MTRSIAARPGGCPTSSGRDERVQWADEPAQLDAVWRAMSARDDTSHQLWTVDYLAAFAQAGDLTLATLDRELPGRYPSVRVESLLS